MTRVLTGPAPVNLPCGDESTWNAGLDVQELRRHIAWCKATNISAQQKGARLETFLCWLLSHVRGFRVEERNLFASDRSQEIDLLVWNEKYDGGFPGWDNKIIAECKNWERPVDSSDVAWFAWKMRLGGVTDGILLAANGITANAARRGAAVSIVKHANADLPQRRIYTLTLDDVAKLASTQDLRRLLIRKSMLLTALDPFSS